MNVLERKLMIVVNLSIVMLKFGYIFILDLR